jgi:hypothetical protein
MPVSKKRKKDGKPVHRKIESTPNPEHAHGPEAAPDVPRGTTHGKPTNPFVAQQTRRASQRGR